jgi:hypothetical protein
MTLAENPLHEACWTNQPNFELIEFLVEEAPELLWMPDKRDFSALQYCPPPAWRLWESFLMANQETWKQRAKHVFDFHSTRVQLHQAQRRVKTLLERAQSM